MLQHVQGNELMVNIIDFRHRSGPHVDLLVLRKKTPRIIMIRAKLTNLKTKKVQLLMF